MAPVALFDMIINGLFFNEPWEFGQVPCAFFVHSTIINKWEKIMNKMFTSSDWEMYKHTLQIGSKLFEMHLIIVLRATKDQLNFLRDSIKNSQVSFPWEENPTLFIDTANFNIMKKFIKYYNLKAYILKIEENLAHSVYGDYPIKMASFNQSVSAKLDIIHEFKKFREGLFNLQDKTLFMAFGFPWQQSYFLQKNQLNDQCYSALPIILRHLGTLSYANDLDILDLLSLRLAISDIRDPSKSNPSKDEIDFMIKRVLVTFTRNNHLSIYKYFVYKNSKPSGLLIFYLVYEFQNLFETFNMSPVTVNSFVTLKDTIKLNEEIDVLNTLKERLNVDYRIDGKGFDQMSISLFVGLIGSENVYAIDLDTNYRWINIVSMFELNRIISAYKEVIVSIYLIGENTYNFIEGFAADLKLISFNNFRFILRINQCNLNDYRIFDNTTVSEVHVDDIKIDLNMLERLEKCGIKPGMFLYGCSLENTCRNWELLNNLGKLTAVEIYEDEGTWLSMFDFILKEIRKSNTNEFQFNTKQTFQINVTGYLRWIDLNKIKFAIDEESLKLEIHDVFTNEIIDLYCKKCIIQQEAKPDYEFYE